MGEPTELDDEINNLLLKHERSNKQQAAIIPGQEQDSDSDNRYLPHQFLFLRLATS